MKLPSRSRPRQHGMIRAECCMIQQGQHRPADAKPRALRALNSDQQISVPARPWNRRLGYGEARPGIRRSSCDYFPGLAPKSTIVAPALQCEAASQIATGKTCIFRPGYLNDQNDHVQMSAPSVPVSYLISSSHYPNADRFQTHTMYTLAMYLPKAR